MDDTCDRSTLKIQEVHPSAHQALTYIRSLPMDKLYTHLEAFSSCAIEGNRLAEVCAGTLSRLMRGQPVSDRYVLGLAWAIRDIEEHNNAG